jgi:hypothetical protein
MMRLPKAPSRWSGRSTFNDPFAAVLQRLRDQSISDFVQYACVRHDTAVDRLRRNGQIGVDADARILKECLDDIECGGTST